VNEVKTYESSLTAPPERADKIFLEGPHSRFDEFVTLLKKAPLIKYSYAFVFMPGGAGTLDELDSVLTLNCYVHALTPRPEARCPPDIPFG
jgi:hypothetical protein